MSPLLRCFDVTYFLGLGFAVGAHNLIDPVAAAAQQGQRPDVGWARVEEATKDDDDFVMSSLLFVLA
jgi:hypothetical protein